MKHQALFSSKDKSQKNKSVVCCSFAWGFKGYRVNASLNAAAGEMTSAVDRKLGAVGGGGGGEVSAVFVQAQVF